MKKICSLVKSLKGEVWKLIPNSTGYEVSNKGRVKSPITITAQNKVIGGNFLSTNSLNRYGYPRVSIKFENGEFRDIPIHRLVAEAFLPNDDISKTDINHKDENKLNNDVSNLEWCTKQYNNDYGTRNERSRLAQSMTFIIYDKTTKSCISKKFIGTKAIGVYFNIKPTYIYSKKFKSKYTLLRVRN